MAWVVHEKLKGTWGVLGMGGVSTSKIWENEVVCLKALKYKEKSMGNAGTELSFLRIVKGKWCNPRIPWPVADILAA